MTNRPSPSFVVQQVPVDSTFALRDVALSPGHPGRPVSAAYDFAPSALHLGILSDAGKVIACVSSERLPFEDSDPMTTFRFHSMAVDPAYQGKGIGRLLLRSLIQELLSQGASLVWATARPSAVDFYRKFGLNVLATPGTAPITGMEIWYVVSNRDELISLFESIETRPV